MIASKKVDAASADEFASAYFCSRLHRSLNRDNGLGGPRFSPRTHPAIAAGVVPRIRVVCGGSRGGAFGLVG
jgi:hypothetical protein